WAYTLTVNPGETKYIMEFVALYPSLAQAAGLPGPPGGDGHAIFDSNATVQSAGLLAGPRPPRLPHPLHRALPPPATPRAPPAITSAATTTFTSGTAGSFQVTATGDPAPTFSLSGQPPWLSIGSTTGVLSGTPPNLGAGPYSFNFTINASNGVGSPAAQSFTL